MRFLWTCIFFLTCSSCSNQTSFSNPCDNIFFETVTKKQIGLCERDEQITAWIGANKDDPDLFYQGPFLGHVHMVATMWGAGPDNLISLSEYIIEKDPQLAQKIKDSSNKDDSEGFYTASTLTGYFRFFVYIFRVNGWEYSIVRSYVRNQMTGEGDIEFENYIMLSSPEGKKTHIEGIETPRYRDMVDRVLPGA